MTKRGIQPPLANCGEAIRDVVIAGENRDYASVARLHAESPANDVICLLSDRDGWAG
jgi:hypothetical protein